jgi:hypothetical protein
VFGSEVQDKVVVSISCLVMLDKTIKYEKSILPLICIVVKLTYFKKIIGYIFFNLVYIEC